MNAYAKKLMTYHTVHQLSREGFSVLAICKQLVMDWRTVRKYLTMSETEYEQFLAKQGERRRGLEAFDAFVKARLSRYPETSAAQMHDWLKEHYLDFPAVDSKTVFNFVAYIRQKYHIDKAEMIREHSMVPETAYGEQAQADFGEYNLRDSQGRKVKVHFFVISLSRSRYKYVWFSIVKFTTILSVDAHQRAFLYFEGIPYIVVYDQDRVFIVDENHGDIILTEQFKAYTRDAGFKLHFCRKADPQSKGKIENIVKYIKRNFLYNRAFDDIETLNQEALAWLARTANHLPHSFTRLQPSREWEIEKQYLKPCKNIVPVLPVHPLYTVRKDNSISYKGNYYSLPMGTYQGKGSQVALAIDSAKITVFDVKQMLICVHNINTSKGQRIINNDHRREKTGKINILVANICSELENPAEGYIFIDNIRSARPRYVRDQLMLLQKTIEAHPRQIISTALSYCCKHNLSSAADLKSIASQLSKESLLSKEKDQKVVPMFRPGMPNAAYIQPEKSSITDYDLF
jgi:transposase